MSTCFLLKQYSYFLSQIQFYFLIFSSIVFQRRKSRDMHTSTEFDEPNALMQQPLRTSASRRETFHNVCRNSPSKELNNNNSIFHGDCKITRSGLSHLLINYINRLINQLDNDILSSAFRQKIFHAHFIWTGLTLGSSPLSTMSPTRKSSRMLRFNHLINSRTLPTFLPSIASRNVGKDGSMSCDSNCPRMIRSSKVILVFKCLSLLKMYLL